MGKPGAEVRELETPNWKHCLGRVHSGARKTLEIVFTH